MRFVKTKLFVSLMGVICLSLVGGYLSITLLFTAPTHAAAARTGKISSPIPQGRSPGGCGATVSERSDAAEACISRNNDTILSDGYVSGECATTVWIYIADLTNGVTTPLQKNDNVCGHFPGPTAPVTPGHSYRASVLFACFPSGLCLAPGSKVLDT
jgi:hypothetical protein